MKHPVLPSLFNDICSKNGFGNPELFEKFCLFCRRDSTLSTVHISYYGVSSTLHGKYILVQTPFIDVSDGQVHNTWIQAAKKVASVFKTFKSGSTLKCHNYMVFDFTSLTYWYFFVALDIYNYKLRDFSFSFSELICKILATFGSLWVIIVLGEYGFSNHS